MSNPVLPFREGLANVSQISLLDDLTHQNWSEIEALETEQGLIDAQAMQTLAGKTLTTATTTSVATDRLTQLVPVSSVDFVPPSPEVFDERPVVPFAFDWLSEGKPSAVETGHWIAAATSSIEHSLSSFGAAMAAQKLHAAVMSLPTEQVSNLLDKAGSAITAIVEQTVNSESCDGDVGERRREKRIVQALAHVAAAVDKDPGHPSSMKLVQDICAVVLAAGMRTDDATFRGLAQAIGAGAGARLALAAATEFDLHDGDRPRAQTLMALVLTGFVRLGERIDEAYIKILKQTGPLCLEWFRWRGQAEEIALPALINALKGQPVFLRTLAPQLEYLERTGLEAFRAIRDLSAYPCDAQVRDVHERFLNSQSVFASIAGSHAALTDILRVSSAANGSGEGADQEAVRLTLVHIGFDAPRAAFLADLSQLGREAMMLGATWTELTDFAHVELQGRAFQRLLTFLNGQYIIGCLPDVVHFDDPDMQT
jgi:hypothetical protein